MNWKFVTALMAAGLMALTGYAYGQDKAKADKPEPPDPKVIETIFTAFSGGLPETWDRAWVTVTETAAKGREREFDVVCLFTVPDADAKGKTIASCDRKTVFEQVWSLNRNIASTEQRRWTSATLVFMPDGKFELNYVYDATAKPKAKTKTKQK